MSGSRCPDCDSDCPGPSDDCHCPCHLPENQSGCDESGCPDCDSDCPGPSDDCHCPCHLPENQSGCPDCDSDCPGPSDDCHYPCHLRPEYRIGSDVCRNSHVSQMSDTDNDEGHDSQSSDSASASARITHETIPPWRVPGEGVTNYQRLFSPSSFCILRRSNNIDDNLPEYVSAPGIVPFSYVRTAILEDGVLPCVINGNLCQMRHVPPQVDGCNHCATNPYHEDECRCSCHYPDVVIDGCWGLGNCEAGCGPPQCMCPCHFLFPWERFFESDENEDEHEDV
jgi:hypothetical protein